MQTAIDNLRFGQGVTEQFGWSFEIDGQPVDFTGYLPRLSVRRHKNRDSELLADLYPDTTPGPDGVLTFTLTSGATDGITDLGKFYYDLRLESPGGFVDFPVAGSIEIFATVTEAVGA